MAQKLREVVNQANELVGYTHWCPGCKGSHFIQTNGRNSQGATWKFNGNLESPTFSPSVRCFTNKGKWEGDKWTPTGPDVTTCHYNITDGSIIYHGDSPHPLGGQTIPLPDYPETII